MMSPRTILPANPLVVGRRPIFAAGLFVGTLKTAKLRKLKTCSEISK